MVVINRLATANNANAQSFQAKCVVLCTLKELLLAEGERFYKLNMPVTSNLIVSTKIGEPIQWNLL